MNDGSRVAAGGEPFFLRCTQISSSVKGQGAHPAQGDSGDSCARACIFYSYVIF